MHLRLTTLSLAVFAVHAAVENITKFPEDECTGECQTYACTQPKVDAIADCFGCSVAYDTTGNSLLGLGQLGVDQFVANCTAAGFPLTNVTVVATKNLDSTSQSAPNTAQSQSQSLTQTQNANPSQSQTNPSQSQSNPAATPSDKNAGVSSTAMSTMTVVISAVVGALLA
ncbi:hypothetical protein C8J56DRAFT_889250 [Mycena floridula]|nr:hypothetical protein C8J56DRAFT_889250 [Mycena floridula]